MTAPASNSTSRAAAPTVLIEGDGLLLRTDQPGALRATLAAAGVPGRRRHDGVHVAWQDAAALVSAHDAGAVDVTWEPAALRAVENRRRVAEVASAQLAEFRRVLAAGPTAARAMLTDCALLPILDDHQAVNVAALTLPGGWGGCIFDEQGTGKTVTLQAVFDTLVERREAEVLLVVSPKSMIAEWATEFRKFTGGTYKVVVLEGDRQAKAALLHSGADVVVCNYETVASQLDDLRLLARRARTILAVDESFNIKNPEALRTAAAAELREWCGRAFVLCGTPAPNAAADVIAQFDLTDFGHAFRGLRVDRDPIVAFDQVRSVMNARGLHVRNVKSTVLPDLPTRTFTEVTVPLAPVQRAAYESALNDLVLDLTGIDDRAYGRQITSYLERRAALLRICSDPSPVVPGYDETPAKIAALDALLHDLVEVRGEKVVLWSFYRASLDRLAARYAPLGLVRVDGSVTDSSARREAVRSLQEDDATRIFLGNPAAAGAGLTLHAARYAVYESLSNQAAHYLQSLDRIHRRGQRRDVEYLTLLCEGTLEEPEYARLHAKAEAQADLLGDPPDVPPTRQVLLAELLDARRRLAGAP